MPETTLGLDLGPASIGWALICDGEDGEGREVLDAGVRVFPEGVDAFDTSKEKSRNEDRRLARAMRRQVRRRVVRRQKLIDALIAAGLWPAGSATQAALYQANPWDLRAKGRSERLEPHEIGRVLLHLNQRRGFWSNRKGERGSDDDTGKVKGSINAVQSEIDAADAGTVGGLMHTKLRRRKQDHAQPQRGEGDDRRVRGRHLSRQQIYTELDTLWRRQAEFHPELLTDRLRWGAAGPMDDPKQAIKARKPVPKHDASRKGLTDVEAFGLHGLIFFQRPIYWPKSVVGLCELEPKLHRCPRADRHAERFRLLQEVNNLRYADPDNHEELALDADQRTLLLDYLATREKANFDQIRKKLGFLDSVKFNLERGKRAGLKGMTLDWLIAKHVGKGWHERPEAEKDAIVDLLRDEEDDDLVVETLIAEHGFSAEEATAALQIDLPTGYMNLSRVAIDKLLPHLERGLVYQHKSDPEQSALHAAGYLRRDELRRRLFDTLPDLRRVNPADCKLGDLPNPVVKRALTEVRKVVNAILRKHGKPDAVHVEMARDLVMGKEKRSEFNTRMRKNEAAREEAADAIRNVGERPSRDAILKYRLWLQQGKECVYSGRPISQAQLFGGVTDIDHILPRSRCLDDSQANKVVCFEEYNKEKGQRTPHEWLADSEPERYDAVCQRAASLLRKGLMPYPKYRRFMQKELKVDGFIARQLNDTGYICRATVEYLQLLFDKPSQVLGLKGQLTAELRWQWGLDTILSDLPDSPAWQEQSKLRPGEKNRADHRHHTIDAVVVALTNRSRLQQLSELLKAKGSGREHGEVLPEPWDGFRSSVAERIAKINVSHRVERKVSGPLHEETLYGPTEHPEEWVVRKPVESLSPAEVERIRDAGIRKIVEAALAKAGVAFGRGNKPNAKKMKEVLSHLRMPSKQTGEPGVPIKRVRIVKAEKTIAPLRERQGVPADRVPNQAYVKPGSTHHLCIFEFEQKGKAKREAVFVTMLEATQRLKQRGLRFAELYTGPAKPRTHKQRAARAAAQQQAEQEHPLVRRTHPTRPDARFVMSLSSGELVLAEVKGEEKLLQFKTSSSTQGTLRFVDHTDARRSSKQTSYFFKANTLKARKVTVDPLGRIRWAND
ncbi:MAG: type II CRISPR RNA-guided endonuclease Cas9 [Planctomycetota bacterium]